MACKCPFCGTLFGNKYILTTHQKKAKYCLAIQGRSPQKIQCSSCGVSFKESSRSSHENECVDFLRAEMVKLKNEKMSLEREVWELKLKLELQFKIIETETSRNIYEKEYKAIRDKPTYNSVTNKLNSINISTIDPFTVDTVRKRLGKGEYTYDLFLQGLEGIQKFILGMITKDDEKSYATTDASRLNFHRLEETKKWVGDKGALFIARTFDEMKSAAIGHFRRFQSETDKALAEEDMEELQRLDDIRENTRDTLTGITHPDSPQRKELLSSIIKYVRPYVAV